MSPSDVTAEDTNKRSKFSYSREFLLSLAKAESIELPKDVCLSISLAFEEGLLSLPFNDSDSRLDTIIPQLPPLKVSTKINESLHKSNIPYCPPHRHKELHESSGFPSSGNLQKGREKRWKHASHEEKKLYADWASLSQEDKRHVNKGKDCNKSSEAFLLSPSSGNFSNLQLSTVVTEQMDAPHKPCLIQETVKYNGLQLTVPRSAKSCSNEHQPLEDDFINNPVNLSHKYVNHMDSYHNLSFLEEGFLLKESEALSNLSRSSFFKKNLFEFGKGEKCEVLEDLFSPPVEDNNLFLSTVGKSTMAHGKGNLFLDGVDHAISLGMKQNSSACDCQILQDLDLNTFSKLEEKYKYSSDLCLPDEDSLIIFDEPFFKLDERNWGAVDEFLSSPEKIPITDEMHTPSSPGEMIVKLVEAILDDESSPAHLVDPEVYYNSGLSADQSHAQFCHYQRSPGWDQQVHNTFQRNSIDSTTHCSLTHHYFPSNSRSPPFHLCHDKMTKFDRTSHPVFQQMKNLDPLIFPHSMDPSKE